MTYPQQPPTRPPYQHPHSRPAGYAPSGYGAAPSQNPSPPAPKNRPVWPWVLACIVLFLITVGSCNSNRTTSTSAGAPTVAPSASTMPSTEAQFSSDALPPAASTSVDAVSPTIPAGPATTMEDGTYEVGTDVAAGKYKTLGDELCYWGRMKANDGSLGDIIDNDVGNGPKTVTIKKGEYFKTQNCGTWSRVG